MSRWKPVLIKKFSHAPWNVVARAMLQLAHGHNNGVRYFSLLGLHRIQFLFDFLGNVILFERRIARRIKSLETWNTAFHSFFDSTLRNYVTKNLIQVI